MPKIDKSSAELIAMFERLLPRGPGVEQKTMFGCACGFVNGQLFSGLHGQRVLVRLPDAERAELAQEEGVGPFGAEGRPMREYLVIERALGREALVRRWIERAFAYASKLPPKQPKARTPASAARLPAPARSAKARTAASRAARRA
jgi:hypothetical protein